MPIKEDRKDLDTTILPGGQQKDHLVLPAAKAPEDFVRPVRKTYRHEKCGAETTMGDRIAETYAINPGFYSGTFCCRCGGHFPVGAEGEFVWLDGTKVGT